MPSLRRTLVQVAAELAAALLLAGLFAGVWALAGERGFLAALSTTAYLAAGIWLFAGSSLFPRLTTLEHAPWSGHADEDTLTADPGTRHRGVALSPLASSVVVAVLLVGIGLLLE